MSHRRFFNLTSIIVIATILLPISPALGMTNLTQAKQPSCTVESVINMDLLAQTIEKDDVKALYRFLSEQGYKDADQLSSISSVNCTDDKNNLTSALIVTIPFTQDGTSLAAHISAWQSNWVSSDRGGSIAVIEKDQDTIYYRSKKKDIVPDTKINWINKVDIPFESIQGFAPPLANEEEIIEVETSKPFSGISNPSVNSIATTYCRTVDVGRIHYTVLGFVAYKFFQRKYWCYDSVAVSNVNVSVYLSDVDPNFYYRGVVNQWDIPGSGYHDSMRQAQVDNCIFQYGCISTSYPAVQIIANANGSYTPYTWE